MKKIATKENMEILQWNLNSLRIAMGIKVKKMDKLMGYDGGTMFTRVSNHHAPMNARYYLAICALCTQWYFEQPEFAKEWARNMLYEHFTKILPKYKKHECVYGVEEE